MSGLHFHCLRVRDVQPDTDDSVVVSFDVPEALADQFRFEPGQYLTLRHEVAGQDLRRSYSICAAAGEAPRGGVRRVPGGAANDPASTERRAPVTPHDGERAPRMSPEQREELRMLLRERRRPRD